MGQKFTYTQIVFGSIALNNLNLGQMFRVAFHKLPTVSWVDFGPFLLTELVKLSQVCRTPCSHTIFSVLPTNSLCDWGQGHSNTLTLLSLSHFPTTLEVCLGSLSIWKTHLRTSFNFLTDVLRCCFNISTEFSCLMLPSILWSAPVPPAAKHPYNMLLLPPCFTVGMVFFDLQATPFFLQT